MQSHKRQFLSLGKRPIAWVVVGALGSLMLTSTAPAQAKRILGTNGPNTIVGTVKADLIEGLRGQDEIRGRGGRDRISGGRGSDRLFGGPGADRLDAVDGLRDRVVRGGPGRDVCRVDATDQANVKGCETVKLPAGGGPGPSPGPGPGPGGPLTCASPPEEPRLAAGGLGRVAQEEQAPTFSEAFYGLTITIKASVDGVSGEELPISIEDVCDVPTELGGEAAQLIGGEGVALVGPETKVFDATGQELTGDAATSALTGADTVSLKAQLQAVAQWRQDEDGQPVPTFATTRADVTD